MNMLKAQTVQEVSDEIDMVDFAIACIRGLRHLKETQDRGELDSVTYHFLARDIQAVIEEVTRSLLVFGAKGAARKIKWIF